MNVRGSPEALSNQTLRVFTTRLTEILRVLPNRPSLRKTWIEETLFQYVLLTIGIRLFQKRNDVPLRRGLRQTITRLRVCLLFQQVGQVLSKACATLEAKSHHHLRLTVQSTSKTFARTWARPCEWSRVLLARIGRGFIYFGTTLFEIGRSMPNLMRRRRSLTNGRNLCMGRKRPPSLRCSKFTTNLNIIIPNFEALMWSYHWDMMIGNGKLTKRQKIGTTWLIMSKRARSSKTGKWKRGSIPPSRNTWIKLGRISWLSLTRNGTRTRSHERSSKSTTKTSKKPKMNWKSL